QIGVTLFELLRHSSSSSGLSNSHPTLAKILLTAFDFGLEFVGELQLVLHHVSKPVQQCFAFRLRQHSYLLFDLLQCWHGVIKSERRGFATSRCFHSCFHLMRFSPLSL